MLLTIVIPTTGRPSLERAVTSCLLQELPSTSSTEIIVVDNTEGGFVRERAGLLELRDTRVRYVHAQAPGVSEARNAGVRNAAGTYVAFLDDDEEVTAAWAASLLEKARNGASAVFGPVEAVFEQYTGCREAKHMFSRDPGYLDGEDITRHRAYLGTGNSMFERSRCFPNAQPFRAEFNVLGGEDAAFLLGLVDSGIRLQWASGARVKEHVAPERVDPNQMIRRRFRNGQVRSFVCFNRGGWRALQGLAWMGVGLVQLFVYGLLSKIIPAKRLHYRLRAAGGFGKVLWARPFWHMSAGALEQARPTTDRVEQLLAPSLS